MMNPWKCGKIVSGMMAEMAMVNMMYSAPYDTQFFLIFEPVSWIGSWRKPLIKFASELVEFLSKTAFCWKVWARQNNQPLKNKKTKPRKFTAPIPQPASFVGPVRETT